MSNLLTELAGAERPPGHEVTDNNLLTTRGDDPIIRLNTELFRLKADKILPLHKLFKLLHPSSLNVIMEHVVTLKLKKGQLLYKQGDAVMQRSYIVLAGKILLKGFLGS